MSDSHTEAKTREFARFVKNRNYGKKWELEDFEANAGPRRLAAWRMWLTAVGMAEVDRRIETRGYRDALARRRGPDRRTRGRRKSESRIMFDGPLYEQEK